MIGGIAAGIVVFNAEKERLENNISRLKKQVKDVYAEEFGEKQI